MKCYQPFGSKEPGQYLGLCQNICVCNVDKFSVSFSTPANLIRAFFFGLLQISALSLFPRIYFRPPRVNAEVQRFRFICQLYKTKFLLELECNMFQGFSGKFFPKFYMTLASMSTGVTGRFFTVVLIPTNFSLGRRV